MVARFASLSDSNINVVILIALLRNIDNNFKFIEFACHKSEDFFAIFFMNGYLC